MTLANETMVAISTPPGRGGIGMVRLSGPHALAISQALVRTRHPLTHAVARLAEVYTPPEVYAPPEPCATPDGGARKLDDAMVTYFAGPNSYTGEDLVEIAAHGSPVVLDLLVRLALRHGARLARPGEFTERAFLSGRIDLTQAEAVRDLIEAQTLYQARIAAEQMGGALSRRIAPAKQTLVELIALLEAGIDFAEDDIEVIASAEIVTRIDTISAALEILARSFAHGRLVHAGLTLAIVGRPNVGKSSLFNRLVERERAIVTAAPGTTRDLVTERVSLGGIPVELVDTAGLREAADEAERLGIEKSREALADADVVLLVTDASAPLRPDFQKDDFQEDGLQKDERQLLASLAGRRALLVRNKCDLAPSPALPSSALQPPDLQHPDLQYQAPQPAPPAIATSALTGQGLAELREALLAMVKTPAAESEAGMLTSVRHHEAVRAALAALEAARAAVAHRIPHEMLLLDLYTALRQLDSLTGETTAADILNRIFSTFCIGK